MQDVDRRRLARPAGDQPDLPAARHAAFHSAVPMCARMSRARNVVLSSLGSRPDEPNLASRPRLRRRGSRSRRAHSCSRRWASPRIVLTGERRQANRSCVPVGSIRPCVWSSSRTTAPSSLAAWRRSIEERQVRLAPQGAQPTCPTSSTRRRARGRGLASQCMAHLLEWAAEHADRVELHASEDGGRAKYRRMGFIETANPAMRLALTAPA